MKTCLLLFANIVVHVLSEDKINATCGDRCCVNFYKDQYNGSCAECPHGTYGLNCTKTCPSMYYGRLCRNVCDCPLQQCDRKEGCIRFETKRKSNSDGGSITWKNVAFTLIGSITIVVVVGIIILIKSILAKRCFRWREILQSNENETENTEEEHRYERRRSLQLTEEVESTQARDQADEKNYTDLRRSALFPIYDNPDECKPGPNSNTAPADVAKSLAKWDLSIDEEDYSSDEEDIEVEGYGQLFKHEMYNVLSLRRTNPDITMHVRPVSDNTMISTSSKETPDGYQSIQLATSKFPENKVETSKQLSRSLSEKATIRQSPISETVEEYIQTSKVTRNLKVFEDEVEQQGMVVIDSESQTDSTEIEQLVQTNTLPYSLANMILTRDLTQDKNPIAESINEDDENEYDVVNKEDDHANKECCENNYDDVNKNDHIKEDDGADKDDVNEDNDGNEEGGGNDDDLYEKSCLNIKGNEGIASSKGNDILQNSCKEAEGNQPEKNPKYEEIPSSSLTNSPEDNFLKQEYTQVIKKRMLSSMENEISQRKPVEVDPVLSKKTIGFSPEEKDKVLSEMCGSHLVGPDDRNLKSVADRETSGNDISDITYRLINTTNL